MFTTSNSFYNFFYSTFVFFKLPRYKSRFQRVFLIKIFSARRLTVHPVNDRLHEIFEPTQQEIPDGSLPLLAPPLLVAG